MNYSTHTHTHHPHIIPHLSPEFTSLVAFPMCVLSSRHTTTDIGTSGGISHGPFQWFPMS